MSTKKEKINTIISIIVAFFAWWLLVAIISKFLVASFWLITIIGMIIIALVAFFVKSSKSYKTRIVRTVAITLFIERLVASSFYICAIKMSSLLADSARSLIDSLTNSDSIFYWLFGGFFYMVFSLISELSYPEKIIPCIIGMTITTLVAFFIPEHKSKKFRIIKIIAIILFIATSVICLINTWNHYLLLRNVFNSFKEFN